MNAMKVKDLKRLLENAPDDAEVALMLFANKYRMEFIYPKRGLLLAAKSGGQVFAINQMGTHFSGQWAQDEYTYIGYIDTGKDNNLKFPKDH